MLNTFWDKNKVFILGLLGAIAVTLEQFINNPDNDIKWKVVGFAALMAVLSYLAKEWRGQSTSIIGILGSLAAAFVTVQNTGKFTWNQFILQAVVAVIAAVASDAKSRGYENTETIKSAKREGEQINPAQLTNKAVKNEAGV
jgi:membrane protein implicated in regulation of membrane protease activity